jgi:Arc/MetJ-type ribon-helix-helix transcriptional regulator
MPRLIITLTPEQDSRVRHIARDRSTSMAEVVRSAIEALPEVPTIDRAARIRRILEASGKYHSGLADVAENHDFYLGEDLLDWRSS